MKTLNVLSPLWLTIDAKQKAIVIELLKHCSVEVAIIHLYDLVLDAVITNLLHKERIAYHLIILTKQPNCDVEGQHVDTCLRLGGFLEQDRVAEDIYILLEHSIVRLKTGDIVCVLASGDSSLATHDHQEVSRKEQSLLILVF